MAYLGIDVGSLYLGLALLDADGKVLRQEYIRHHGEPGAKLRAALGNFPLGEVQGVVRTGAGGANLPAVGEYIDAVVAGVEGAKATAPDIRNVIYIGGGSFSLARLNADGSYQRSTVNSACASGTGAFLDQQALRLQIPPAELATRAMRYDQTPPAVATRCAVFAKSDMIHLQQEGFSQDAIAAGLCAGLGRSTIDGLLGGHKLTGKTALIGGVARNTVVVAAAREKLGVETIVPESPELVCALGAAQVARQRGGKAAVDCSALLAERDEAGGGQTYLRPPLELKLSKYPDFACHDHWVDECGSEIAIIAPRSGRIRVSLGLDIGSTSTKACLLDEQDQVVGWIYRKTAGEPIRAVQLVCRAFRTMEQRGGFALDVRAVGTTGSGRKMIKEVIHADVALNEITAHARAAVFLDPQVDTILELGGQDAKFTQLQNGMVYNSVMNYVCAAGTGSFIEEQALKLGIPLTEYADRAMGQNCPQTSDRCTVYMERDLDLLQARGWKKEQVAAAVLHSVRDNYLNKVVGGLHIGDHIYFQGATARNRALVAAFECELKKPIQVSPFCHVTGALGMCLMARERAAADGSTFKGFGFADEKISVDYETCELCHNRCLLSIIHAGTETVAWGLKCGRDYSVNKMKVKRAEGYEWWRKREAAWLGASGRTSGSGRKVGLLRGLGTYGYYPFWKAFLEALGCEVVYSSPTREETIRRGVAVSTAEYCAPVVANFGHAVQMLEPGKVDWLFVPHMIREPLAAGFTDSHFCCYVQAQPSVLKSMFPQAAARILAPIVQLNLPDEYQIEKLREVLGPALGSTRGEVAGALASARRAQQEFNQEARRLGTEALKRIETENQLGIVCIGRPYNTLDAGLTLDLPRKIAELGYTVLYLDMVPYDLNSILPGQANMYWHYGQKILAAAEYVAASPRLFGVYFTNFMCGPDSYILTYFKEIMGRAGKPYLCLQFDGHGADAGYLTRVEAALESFHAYSRIPRPEERPAAEPAAV